MVDSIGAEYVRSGAHHFSAKRIHISIRLLIGFDTDVLALSPGIYDMRSKLLQTHPTYLPFAT